MQIFNPLAKSMPTLRSKQFWLICEQGMFKEVKAIPVQQKKLFNDQPVHATTT